MTHILKKLILTAILTLFASQANAMWIQPDWYEVTEPGVGTNRYAYSGNDPINNFDPNGNAYHDWDKDQEEADEDNRERADRFLDEAERIRESEKFSDQLREFFGVARKYERVGDHYQSRIGVSQGDRIRRDIGETVATGLMGLRPNVGLRPAPVPRSGPVGVAVKTPLQSRQLAQQLRAEELAGVRMPTAISGYTKHGINQAISRNGVGVSTRAVNQTFRNPSKIEHVATQYGPSFRLTGSKAVVVVNPQGQVVTTWARGNLGVRGF